MIQLARTCELGEIKSTLIKTSIKHVASKVQWSLGASFLEINKTFQGSYFYNFFLHVSWTQLKGILKIAKNLKAPDFRDPASVRGCQVCIRPIHGAEPERASQQMICEFNLTSAGNSCKESEIHEVFCFFPSKLKDSLTRNGFHLLLPIQILLLFYDCESVCAFCGHLIHLYIFATFLKYLCICNCHYKINKIKHI